MLSSRSTFPVLLKVAILVAVGAVALCATTPRGWMLGGSKPHDYETGIDDAQYNGHRIAYLKAVAEAPSGFGTLMQYFRANRYAGTRVQLRAALKADQVSNWAGLWMRVDKTAEDTTRVLAFDNMHDRPVNGTTGWRDCQVVLDVPADASNIYFGVILGGSGQVSISDISIESVDQDVPVTAAKPVSYFRSHDKLRDFRRPLETPFNLEFQP